MQEDFCIVHVDRTVEFLKRFVTVSVSYHLNCKKEFIVSCKLKTGTRPSPYFSVHRSRLTVPCCRMATCSFYLSLDRRIMFRPFKMLSDFYGNLSSNPFDMFQTNKRFRMTSTSCPLYYTGRGVPLYSISSYICCTHSSVKRGPLSKYDYIDSLVADTIV